MNARPARFFLSSRPLWAEVLDEFQELVGLGGRRHLQQVLQHLTQELPLRFQMFAMEKTRPVVQRHDLCCLICSMAFSNNTSYMRDVTYSTLCNGFWTFRSTLHACLGANIIAAAYYEKIGPTPHNRYDITPQRRTEASIYPHVNRFCPKENTLQSYRNVYQPCRDAMYNPYINININIILILILILTIDQSHQCQLYRRMRSIYNAKNIDHGDGPGKNTFTLILGRIHAATFQEPPQLASPPRHRRASAGPGPGRPRGEPGRSRVQSPGLRWSQPWGAVPN